MIKEALEYLANIRVRASDTETLWIEGRPFIKMDGETWDEVLERQTVKRSLFGADGRPLVFASFTSLVDIIRSYPDLHSKVLVGSKSASVVFWDPLREAILDNQTHVGIMSASVAYAFVPQSHQMTFEKFLVWMDEYGTDIFEYDKLKEACQFIKISEASAITVTANGPFVTLASSAQKGVEGSRVQVPREITVMMPTGTREFILPNTFILSVKIKEGQGAWFDMTPKRTDQLWNDFTESAMKLMREAQLPNCLILEGA